MRIVVIGAGVGGLVAGLELAHAGCDVTIVEKEARPGGKMRRVTVAGHEVNAGPTVFTMRWVFDALFRDLGRRLEDHVALRPVEILARHAWTDGSRLDLFADRARSEDAIAAFAGKREAQGYREFCRLAGRLYDALWPTFINADKPTAVSLAARIARHDFGGLTLVNPMTSLWQTLSRLFQDPRLVQLFGRYATYCGSSPFSTASMLMLVAHVEQEGVWLVDGGMAGLATTLAALARETGATVRLGEPVRAIVTRAGRVTGVALASGEHLPADAIVFAGDCAAVAAGLLGPDVAGAVPDVPEHARSLSALTVAAVVRPTDFPLVRHNVFFGDDYPAEFAAIFRQRRLPPRPTVYICAEDRDDGAAPPGGTERLLFLVNAPATGDKPGAGPTPQEIDQCLADMQRVWTDCGASLKIDPTAAKIATARDFEQLFPATGGALYGRNAHGWAAAFQRPGARTRIPGLYLAGGSVHPGPGVPMAALSGRMAAQTLMSDHPSMRPSRRAGMRGGTSTR